MTSRNGSKSLCTRQFQEDTKFHVAIAHDIGIRRNPSLVSVEQIFYHACSILLHEVHNSERDSEVFRDSTRILDVLLPGTVPDDVLFIDPVLHVGALDRLRLAMEQQRSHTAIDAARHRYENTIGIRHWKRN